VEYEIKVVSAPDRDHVAVLGATFEPGKPTDAERGRWRSKLRNREEMLRYLKYNERYQYGEGVAFGSEKRKTAV
jgi:hypothetical protein